MKIARIVFPGYVKNPEKAINMLGGSHEIYKQCSSENPQLQISFRPNDPLAHKIESNVKTDPSIIIRIKVVRQFKIVNGEKEIISQKLIPEYIGKTIQSICFGKPSDFQFLPSLSTTLCESTVSNPPPQQFLYLPPPVFIHNYNYNSYYIQKRIFSNRQQDSYKFWKKDECTWIINQDDLHSQENGPRPPPMASDVVKELVEIFEEMFEQRPIWTAIALFDHLNQINETRGNILDMSQQNPQIFHCLAVVAYHIKNGPFKMCWVRYGVNPILTNTYALHQTITLALKDFVFADELIQEAKKGSRLVVTKISDLPLGISKIQALPERLQYVVQLIDLNTVDHPFIAGLLAEQQETFSFTTGWYSSQIIETIRKFILLKLQRMVVNKNKIPASLIMRDIVSQEQIQKEIDAYRTKAIAIDSFDFELMNQVESIFGGFGYGKKESFTDLLDYCEKGLCISYCDMLQPF